MNFTRNTIAYSIFDVFAIVYNTDLDINSNISSVTTINQDAWTSFIRTLFPPMTYTFETAKEYIFNNELTIN